MGRQSIFSGDKRCLVPIQMGSCFCSVWCDVLPMDISQILLGQPWVEALDVDHDEKMNTYTFKVGRRTTQLNPERPKVMRVLILHHHKTLFSNVGENDVEYDNIIHAFVFYF